jgi:radical SAM protein with 4Fe4S-binding SPASM domain
MPWEEAVLRWNGDVQVCNMFNPYIYGNIKLNSFKNIWNNAYAQTFRKNVNGDFKHPYCKDCAYMRDAYACRSV